MQTVAEAIAYIHNRPKGGQKESLVRMHTLLAALGQPQNMLPPAIHITGTNGKGSVATMTSNILRVAGYRTGLFISPFITDFRERIQINNHLIPADDLLAVTQHVADVLVTVDATLAPDIPTEFEVLTAIMLTYFAQQNLDALVIEVGIGGQLDSTNVMPNARVAVITSVGLDHQALLGPTITAIAKQKAGIIHDDMAVVIGDLPDEAQAAIAAIAKRPLIQGQLNAYTQGLPGTYQIQNTATAVAAINAFDDQITPAQIQQGLAESRFSGRFERLKPNVLLDGAHNVDGLRQLHQALQDLDEQPETITLIIGSLMDKNVALAFDELLKDQRLQIVLVPFVGPNGRHSLDIDAVAEQYGLATADSWQAAYQASTSDLIVFTGSLYFVSEVRGKI
ncbi:bifunctional folylpolyglutamate synthase/dihydrofolate synthase [Leuconostoc lactis]|uniref:bifunctional folylpolyglutamate synthase/dihydrofolate synthase n=1 Tax=Leuconostoc lactis TaxID=1246 RepID=UPI00289F9E6B|nr:Mur ligase family protein [Leuconostoc lactis]